jgi:hypothetical protein
MKTHLEALQLCRLLERFKNILHILIHFAGCDTIMPGPSGKKTIMTEVLCFPSSYNPLCGVR